MPEDAQRPGLPQNESTATGDWQRLAIVIHSLTGGGSEHVAAAMASHWAEAGKQVTLLTLDSVDNDQIACSEKVDRVGLDLMGESRGLWSAIVANRQRVRALRRAFVQCAPDRVISLTDRTNILTLLAARGTRLRVVVSERTDIRHHRIGRVWEWLRRRTYPQARAIVVQTEAVLAAVRGLCGQTPVHVIPNAAPSAKAPSAQAVPVLRLSVDRNWFVAVGRLSLEKGFDRLIHAFVRIADRCPDWNLVIVGDGPEKPGLESLINDAGLEDRVLLPGWVESPWSCFPESSVFVLPSRYEGFPNALLEAMSRGMAPVAFDCESGPSEIMRPGVDGLLVPEGDVAGLAAAMQQLAGDAEYRNRLAVAARSVNERFSSERVYAQWEVVLADV